jgi:hypothetical protein
VWIPQRVSGSDNESRRCDLLPNLPREVMRGADAASIVVLATPSQIRWGAALHSVRHVVVPAVAVLLRGSGAATAALVPHRSRAAAVRRARAADPLCSAELIPRDAGAAGRLLVAGGGRGDGRERDVSGPGTRRALAPAGRASSMVRGVKLPPPRLGGVAGGAVGREEGRHQGPHVGVWRPW